jgi:hypothetical protein
MKEELVTLPVKTGSEENWKEVARHTSSNREILDTCKNKQHNFVEIYRAGEPGHQDIVKWCTICGTIVIDHEGEGKVATGSTIKVMGPKVIDLL